MGKPRPSRSSFPVGNDREVVDAGQGMKIRRQLSYYADMSFRAIMRSEMPAKLVRRTAALLLATACAPSTASAQTANTTSQSVRSGIPASADPLTVAIHIEDVERFATVLSITDGRPTASDIQKGYLDNALYGVSAFMPGRIGDAARLANKVNADPALYTRAVRECLPRIKEATADLRAIHLALHGLLPDQPRGLGYGRSARAGQGELGIPA